MFAIKSRGGSRDKRQLSPREISAAQQTDSRNSQTDKTVVSPRLSQTDIFEEGDIWFFARKNAMDAGFFFPTVSFIFLLLDFSFANSLSHHRTRSFDYNKD